MVSIGIELLHMTHWLLDLIIGYIIHFSVICSDAMARGMDIENVKYVISYDPPPFIKTYIHRVGRTARAGKVGTAITMLQKKEVRS